ncbi:hypothetical protein [Rhizobium sp. BR 315]|uniref:hypothetical protein n=1 Tax=Rhizobium sp. BR 315 TaxID=3040014 RepID=UPI003D32510D
MRRSDPNAQACLFASILTTNQHVDYFVKIELEGRVVRLDRAEYDISTGAGTGIRREAG